MLEDKTSYGDTFFVPVRARWHEPWYDDRGDLVPALKDLKHDIGNMLNKAIAAIEDDNDVLAGVLKNNIDFNAVKGRTKIPDQKWKDLLRPLQPAWVRPRQRQLRVPRPARRRLRSTSSSSSPTVPARRAVSSIPRGRSSACSSSSPSRKPATPSTTLRSAPAASSFRPTSTWRQQGHNADNLALYGQDSNGTVWSICIMNMILHNITRFTIENGDTLEDPVILDNGQIRKFDRVLANPPFSQNYSRAGMRFTSRFREWCPESGKKADLMFVQHMLASLKSNGRMATIMPHGVLFRGGKERLIRELFINDDCIEAIVSLPPGLFYGTGIPACVLVCNKSKPDALKDKVLFINADREYAEGKNQNRLRPEDIEKIDSVFIRKRELPKYSRLVPKSEIVDTHDYNLNIRRYVDNTPDPEPEDVQAHLIGGIPDVEVAALTGEFAKFGIATDSLFEPERPGYLAFRESIDAKPAIRATLEVAPALLGTLTRHHGALESWWAVAADDFAQHQHAGNGGKKMPEARHELLATLKAKLVPLIVLDEFKSAGVFVKLVAADPLRPEDHHFHWLAPHAHPRWLPDRRVLPGPMPTPSRRWRRPSPKPRASWPRSSRPPRRSAATNPMRTRRSPPPLSRRPSRRSSTT